MLTRLEVSGFKNLRDVVVDLGPFTVVAGPNGVGKSNLFDVIHLLSLLVDHPIKEAFRRVRVSPGQKAPLRTLFPQEVLAGRERVRLAAETIVPSTVNDWFGSARVDATYLRYAVEFACRGGSDGVTLEVARESLKSITVLPRDTAHSEAEELPGGRTLVMADGRLRGRAGLPPFRGPEIAVGTDIYPEGGGGADPGMRGTSTWLYMAKVVPGFEEARALCQEMLSWRLLSLEPSAMRTSDDRDETAGMTQAGAHLPVVLHTLASRRGEQVYEDVVAAAYPLIDLRSLTVVPNGDYLELRAQVGDGPQLPARNLSDGTLRFIALAVLAVLDDRLSLLAVEEPENGLHPSRTRDMLDLLRLASQERDGRLRQVVVNTHSPYLVKEVERRHPEDLLCAVRTKAPDGDGGYADWAAFRPLAGTWRSEGWREGRGVRPVSRGELADFLHGPREWSGQGGWSRGDGDRVR